MYLEGLHEKEIFSGNYPFRLEYNDSEDFNYPLHWHNAVELVYNCENNCRVGVNGSEYLLSENEILFIPAGEIHDIHSIGKGKRFFIQFEISKLDGFGNMEKIKPPVSKTRRITRIDNNHLYNLIEEQIKEMIEEYKNKEAVFTLSLHARVCDILVAVTRDQVNKMGTGDAKGIQKKVYGLEKINNAMKFIEENYSDNITLKDVANAAGYSEYHFSRVFKEIMEKNFHSYLNELRVNKAEALLMHNDTGIAYVANEVGFNSFVTFNRIFKALKGCTPSVYKKIHI
jgi:AraC-like DNA-binding protein